MRPEHLKEAGEIVSSLAWFANARKLSVDPTIGGFGAVRVAPPGFDRQRQSSTDLALTQQAAEAALAVLRKSWDAREAQLRRRAAQIGLTLEISNA
jgi:hypothetical protein